MSKTFFDIVDAQDILDLMWEKCEREQFYDVVLIAGTEEKQIPAHRSVLCAASEYFGTMFTAPFNESTAREVKIPSVDGETVKTLVKYCYMRHIEITEDNVEKLLEAADLQRFDFVVNACCDFLAEQLHPSNCFALMHIAQRHHCKSLSKKAKDYCVKHFAEINKTDDFLQLNADQLGQLLSSGDLCATSEDIFKDVMAWIEYNPLEREQNKDDFFKLISMHLMELSFLDDHVKPHCTTFACLQLYREATQWQMAERKTPNVNIATAKPKKDQLLMAVFCENDRFNILYHCPIKCKWMKWLKDMEHFDASFAVMEDNLFLVGRRTAKRLNLRTMTLKEISPPNESFRGFSLAVLKGVLYAIGCGVNKTHLTCVKKWNAINDTWSEVAPMSISRRKPGITVFNEKLYVIGGGRCYPERACVSGEYYDPEKNVWVTIASMWEGRQYPALADINGTLYAVGGNKFDMDSETTTIERFNPVIDSWIMSYYLDEAIAGELCTTFGDKVILLYSDRVEEYNPMTNQCEVNASIRGLADIGLASFNVHYTFSYSEKLLVTEFVEKKILT